MHNEVNVFATISYETSSMLIIIITYKFYVSGNVKTFLSLIIKTMDKKNIN